MLVGTGRRIPRAKNEKRTKTFLIRNAALSRRESEITIKYYYR